MKKARIAVWNSGGRKCIFEKVVTSLVAIWMLYCLNEVFGSSDIQSSDFYDVQGEASP